MVQPLSSLHQIPTAVTPARRVVPLVGMAAGLVALTLVVGALALWAHYGTTVFFETIVSGVEACF